MKTGDPKGFQSSNLCASARLNKGLPLGKPFVFLVLNTFIEQITVTPIKLTMDDHLFSHTSSLVRSLKPVRSLLPS
ncbi:hypothetical protein C2U51_11580 [Enterobacteriaceae bacterium ENNIH1]|nr:hypothetical protein C2U51_11580 [Enterobacteriaceae bacterium ENNIH1]